MQHQQSQTLKPANAKGSESSLHQTSLGDQLSKNDVKSLTKEQLIRLLYSDKVEANRVVEHYSNMGTKQEGWCLLSLVKPSKLNGYIQISWAGKDKVVTLGPVVAVAAGSYRLGDGQNASHLCGNPACLVVGHVVFEDSHVNQLRKGCEVWIDCPHDNKKIFVCKHNPPCIKYADGFDNMEDLMAKGICNDKHPAREQARRDAQKLFESGRGLEDAAKAIWQLADFSD